MNLKLAASILFVLFTNSLFSEIYLISQYEINARSTALNHGDFAFSSDISSVHSNPASISDLEKHGMELTYLKGFAEDVRLTNLTLVTPHYKDIATFGIGVVYLDYGEFQNVPDNTTFNSYDMMLTFSAGKEVYENLSVGSSVDFYYSKIEDFSSSGVGLNISALYRMLDKRLRVSTGIFNIGTQFDKYNTTKEDLPTQLKAGLAYNFETLPIEAGGMYSYHTEGYSEYVVSAEMTLKNDFKVRAGYDFTTEDKEIGTKSRSEKFAGLSTGMSVSYEAFNFDLGYVISGELEDQYNFTLGVQIPDREDWSFFGSDDDDKVEIDDDDEDKDKDDEEIDDDDDDVNKQLLRRRRRKVD